MSDQSQSLIVLDYRALKAKAIDQAKAIIDEALAQAALIAKVTAPEENARAFAAQKAVKVVLNEVERSRKEAKDPLTKMGRAIDALARDLSGDLQEEYNRLGRAIGDFAQAELARQRAAEAARLKGIQERERERERQVAEAETIEEQVAIRERAAEEERVLPPAPIPAPAFVKGQTVREDWEIVVVDIWALSRAFPQCVRIEPNLVEIRERLDLGMTLPGVQAEKVVKSGVRVGTGKAVDV